MQEKIFRTLDEAHQWQRENGVSTVDGWHRCPEGWKATLPSEVVSIKDLNFGDRIQIFQGAYSTCTVKQVTRETVFLVRPYIHAEGVAGKLITYIGLEEFTLWRGSTNTVLRLEKGKPLN